MTALVLVLAAVFTIGALNLSEEKHYTYIKDSLPDAQSAQAENNCYEQNMIYYCDEPLKWEDDKGGGE